MSDKDDSAARYGIEKAVKELQKAMDGALYGQRIETELRAEKNHDHNRNCERTTIHAIRIVKVLT